jgi:hypothetical protein
VLPLRQGSVASAAVIGHNANYFLALVGNYWGPPCEPTVPLAGIQWHVKNVRFLAGCNSAACNAPATDQAEALVRSVHNVFLFMGLSQNEESEGRDRTTLLLLGCSIASWDRPSALVSINRQLFCRSTVGSITCNREHDRAN